MSRVSYARDSGDALHDSRLASAKLYETEQRVVDIRSGNSKVCDEYVKNYWSNSFSLSAELIIEFRLVIFNEIAYFSTFSACPVFKAFLLFLDLKAKY